MGPLRVTPGVLPRMRAQGGARVILVSSVTDSSACRSRGVLSEQVAIEAMGEALAMEVAQMGITVSIVEPGL